MDKSNQFVSEIVKKRSKVFFLTVFWQQLMSKLSLNKGGKGSKGGLNLNVNVKDWGLAFHKGAGAIFMMLAPSSQRRYVQEYCLFRDYKSLWQQSHSKGKRNKAKPVKSQASKPKIAKDEPALPSNETMLLDYISQELSIRFKPATIISKVSMVRQGIYMFEGIQTYDWRVVVKLVKDMARKMPAQKQSEIPEVEMVQSYLGM